MPNFKHLDFSGKKYNKLTLIEIIGKNNQGSYLWKCRCDCGNFTTGNISDMKRNKPKSCGCIIKNKPRKENLYHPLMDGTTVVELTKNKFVIVDTKIWFDKLIYYKWSILKTSKNGYAQAFYEKVDGKNKMILMHRMVMDLLEHKDKIEVDHINRDGLDNRLSNLRLVTRKENSWNIGKISSNNSGYIGVSWNTNAKKWRSSIEIKGKSIHLGYFSDIIEAAKAYDRETIRLHGELAVTNF